MRILHCLANYKWTGPAEPAVQLAARLKGLGLDLAFACGVPPEGVENDVARHAGALGLSPITDFRLDKHLRPVNLWRTARRMALFLDEQRFDIVHCHQPGDHAIAGWAARRARRRPLVLRTCYDAALPPGWRSKWLCGSLCDGLFAVSLAVRQEARALARIAPDRLFATETPVDLRRFDPSRALPDMRARLNIPADAFVIGVVARLQRHRRFELLLEAFARLAPAHPMLRLLVVGRGTHGDAVLHEPARALGLSSAVIAPGYLTGDDLVGALRAMDAFCFLVPGSDGTCRAVREAMAMALPVAATRRGMLGEIVRDGETGALFDEHPEALAALLARWIADPQRARALGCAGAVIARADYDLNAIAGEVARRYEELAASRGPCS